MAGQQVVERDLVDAAAAYDADRVVRRVDAVLLGQPPAHQEPDRRAGPGQADQHRRRLALEHQLAGQAYGQGEPDRALAQRLVEQRGVGRVGLVLDRQHLEVVPAALDQLFPVLGRQLELDVPTGR